MQKNKLAKFKELDFLSRLTTALAPADENVFRQIQEAPKTTNKRERKVREPQFTARYLGSI